MSGPFSPASPNGQPLWSSIPTVSGNFSKISVGSGETILEVGYGEGGYGDDGYDTPSINIPAAATPNWTVEVVR